jgi:hypothetical protein
VTIKELLEVIFLIIGGGGATATAGFAFAIYQEKQKLDQLRLDIKDGQLNFQAQFARKVQKNIDSNQVEIGILKSEIGDIKEIMQGNHPAARRQFPPENKPKHTGWTIEDA